MRTYHLIVHDERGQLLGIAQYDGIHGSVPLSALQNEHSRHYPADKGPPQNWWNTKRAAIGLHRRGGGVHKSRRAPAVLIPAGSRSEYWRRHKLQSAPFPFSQMDSDYHHKTDRAIQCMIATAILRSGHQLGDPLIPTPCAPPQRPPHSD